MRFDVETFKRLKNDASVRLFITIKKRKHGTEKDIKRSEASETWPGDTVTFLY